MRFSVLHSEISALSFCEYFNYSSRGSISKHAYAKKKLDTVPCSALFYCNLSNLIFMILGKIFIKTCILPSAVVELQNARMVTLPDLQNKNPRFILSPDSLPGLYLFL